MFRPITLKREWFTVGTNRLLMLGYLRDQIEQAIIHPTTPDLSTEAQFDLHAVQQRLLVLQSLIYMLVENQHVRRTLLTRHRRKDAEPLTVDKFAEWQQDTVTAFVRKAPVHDVGVTIGRAFIIYELNRINITE